MDERYECCGRVFTSPSAYEQHRSDVHSEVVTTLEVLNLRSNIRQLYACPCGYRMQLKEQSCPLCHATLLWR